MWETYDRQLEECRRNGSAPQLCSPVLDPRPFHKKWKEGAEAVIGRIGGPGVDQNELYGSGLEITGSSVVYG